MVEWIDKYVKKKKRSKEKYLVERGCGKNKKSEMVKRKILMICGARVELMTNKVENVRMDGEWKYDNVGKKKKEKEGLVNGCTKDK